MTTMPLSDTLPSFSKFSKIPEGIIACDPFETPLHNERLSLQLNNLASLLIPMVATALSYKHLGVRPSRLWIPLTLATVAGVILNFYLRSQTKSEFFLQKIDGLFNRLIEAVKHDENNLKQDLSELKAAFSKSSINCSNTAQHYAFYARLHRATVEICRPGNLAMTTSWYYFLKRVDGQFSIQRPDRAFSLDPIFEFIEVSKETSSTGEVKCNLRFIPREASSLPKDLLCHEDPNQEIKIGTIDVLFSHELSHHVNLDYIRQKPSRIFQAGTTLPFYHDLTTLLSCHFGKDFSHVLALMGKTENNNIFLPQDRFYRFLTCIPCSIENNILTIYGVAVDPKVPDGFNLKSKALTACLNRFRNNPTSRVTLQVQVTLRASDSDEQAFYVKHRFKQTTKIPEHFKDPTEVGIVYSRSLLG